jgi:UDP-N-acetylmuramate: L-alanyl-gamma-D-glutamyl-meso-diaminopimelate ligase
MHLHILGICGTFMGGLAQIARAAGHTVTGCDADVYPPMSTQLAASGIELTQGYAVAQLDNVAKQADVFVIGNALSRGNPLLEAILDSGRRYTSGPQWLADAVLRDKWVLAVAGTHGKTTTTALLAWILDQAGLDPGFLIGGVATDFGVSARLSDGPFFVIEADEYDTAFSDKRAKFVHYRPRTAILNNLEYDHADIFPNLAAIETQFHHFVRTIPHSGRLIVNGVDENLRRVLGRGCWSETERFRPADPPGIGSDWTIAEDGAISFRGASQGVLSPFGLFGQHNRLNALAAIAAARHVSVPVRESLAALASFRGVKRRMEQRGTVGGVTVYDDFAHHPTAIAASLEGLRRQVDGARIVAVFEPRSATMKRGAMKDDHEQWGVWRYPRSAPEPPQPGAMIRIAYLHGFNSGPASVKGQALARTIAALPAAVRPEYFLPRLSHWPTEAVRAVNRWAENAGREGLTFVGSSLGGFYATHLAEAHGAKAVLVNPALHPERTLAPYLGPQRNPSTGERYELTRAHLDEFSALQVQRITHPQRYLLLAQAGDELLDWRQAIAFYAGAWQFILGGGDHAYENFVEQAPLVLRFAGADPAPAA